MCGSLCVLEGWPLRWKRSNSGLRLADTRCRGGHVAGCAAALLRLHARTTEQDMTEYGAVDSTVWQRGGLKYSSVYLCLSKYVWRMVY